MTPDFDVAKASGAGNPKPGTSATPEDQIEQPPTQEFTLEEVFRGVLPRRSEDRAQTIVEQLSESASRDGELINAAPILATAALVDLAQGTNPAAIIATQRRSRDTHGLIVLRHFADPCLRPIIDDVLLANSAAGDQFKLFHKIATSARAAANGAKDALLKIVKPRKDG